MARTGRVKARKAAGLSASTVFARDGSCAPLASVQQLLLRKGAALPFVISTGAYPDFLLRVACNDHVCGSRRESRMQIIKATGLDMKSGECSGEICGFQRCPLEAFRRNYSRTRQAAKKPSPG
jgi:hypothetical protein